MNAKRYFYLGIVGVVLVAVAMVPWIDGLMFKGSYLRYLSILNKDRAVKAELVEYNTGWLSSTAKLVVANPASPRAAAATITQKIIHGPFFHHSRTEEWTFGFAEIDSTIQFNLLDQLLGNQWPLLQINSVVNFFGGFKNQIQAPPVTLNVPMVGKITWAGMQGLIDLDFSSQHLEEVKSSIGAGGIQVEGGGGFLLSVAGYTDTNEQTRADNGMMVGQGNMQIPSIALTLPTSENIRIENITVNRSYTTAPHIYNIEMKLRIGNLAFPGFAFAPVTFNAKQLGLNADVLSKNMNLSLDDLFPKLITPNSALLLEMSAIATNGQLSANAEIRWPTPLSSSDMIYKNSNIKANFKISKTLVDQYFAWMDEHYPVESSTPATVAMPAPPSANVGELNNYVTEKKITQEIATRLAQLQKASLSSEVYNAAIDSLVKQKQIPQDLGDQLKASYITQEDAGNNDQTAMSQAQTVKSLPSQSMRDQLASYIAAGYVIQQGEEYFVAINIQQGSVMVNGKPYTPGMPIAPTTGR